MGGIGEWEWWCRDGRDGGDTEGWFVAMLLWWYVVCGDMYCTNYEGEIYARVGGMDGCVCGGVGCQFGYFVWVDGNDNGRVAWVLVCR